MDNPTEIDPKEYVEVLAILRTIDFLSGVDDAILKNLLFYLQKQSFPKNRQILFRGEIANRLFIVRKGSAVVSIRKDGQPMTLAELTPPNYFGEISLLRPMSATANVKAGDEGLDAVVLTFEAMAQVKKCVPDIEQRIQNVIDNRIAATQKARKGDDEDEEASG